jgi:hypothetical protein
VVVVGVVLMSAFAFLFFVAGFGQVLLTQFSQTPTNPKGYKVVRYDSTNGLTERPASEPDMIGHKFGALVPLALAFLVFVGGGFVMLSAVLGSRNRLLAWVILQVGTVRRHAPPKTAEQKKLTENGDIVFFTLQSESLPAPTYSNRPPGAAQAPADTH